MFSVITLVVEFVLKMIIKEMKLGSGMTEAVDVAFIGLFSVAFMYDIGHSKRLKEFSTLLFLSYLFRIALLFFDRYGQKIYQLPNSGADSEGYYINAVRYSNNGHNSMGYFSEMFGTLFKLIGTSRLYGQFIVVLFSVVSLILFALLLNKIDIENNTKITVYTVICLLPNFAIISSIFLRESIIAMLITISFYIFYKWLNGGSYLYFILAFASAFCASAFHSGSAAVAVGYIAIILLYDQNKKTFKLRAKNIIPAIILIGIVAFMYVNYSSELFGKMQSVEKIEDIAGIDNMGGSSYARYVGDSSNPLNMIVFTPLRIVFFLFSPFPWQWRGLSDIIAFVFSSMFFIYAAWCDIRFLKSGEKKNRTLVIALTIVVACTVFVFAWGVSNTGTACRHREKITIIWGLVLALTYTPYRPKTKEGIRK